ncbi:MAG TPA: UDP-glucose 4-epimerase GalE [Terriglobales bacterium]|nr:UDP-glucose 4-epimerase GalE [Terriglobales bacterium]
MNILVTGGAGYVGSVVAAELLAADHRVVVYDNLSRGKRGAIPAGAEFVLGDIEDRQGLVSVLNNCKAEAVLHFAALIEAGESMKVPERYFRKNTAAALTLLEAMLEAGVKKFIFSSTAAVYGNPVNIPIQESDPLCPTNAYGESKLLVERMLEWLNRVHGLRYASLRYFNAAGAAPGRGEAHNPESHLIPLVLKVALGQRENIAIFGTDYPTPDGTCIRDYVHILDLAAAHVAALHALSGHERLIYNLGNGRGFSVREVVKVARMVTGHSIPVVENPRRPGDSAVLVASSAKAKSELGWNPRYPDLEQIVGSAWKWHKSHPQGYD